jgi:hypothetical protein
MSLLDSTTEPEKPPRTDRGTRNVVNGRLLRPHKKLHIYLSFSSVDYAALLDSEESKRRIDAQIRANAARPLFTGIAVSVYEYYLHYSHLFPSMTPQKSYQMFIPLILP